MDPKKPEQKKVEFATALTKVNNAYFPMIERQLSGNGIRMDDYAKQCVINAISSIHTALDSKGLTWNDQQLDNSNVTQVLLSIAALKLNAAASPREVYFQVRNVKVKVEGKDVWKKQIEMGIEGDGNDAILARFGRDIKKVAQFWLVREGDQFEYPKYNGLEVTPPKWTPTGKGDVIRVVYPVVKNDDSVEYYIAERDDSLKNLIAHINNNLMNETFGVCPDRYKATPEQKKEIAAKKTEVLKKAKEMGLAALDDPDLQQWISPAWTEFQSRESMIIRKMRNNIVKKIPKDFGSAYVEMTYHENTDESLKDARREISEHANGQVIDIDAAVVNDDTDNGSTPPQEAPPTETGADKAHDPVPAEHQETNLPPTGTDGPPGPDF